MDRSDSSAQSIRIGGATGYWGEADLALPQFLAEGDCNYVVFDYLAEITMSILARAHAARPDLGYATDFLTDVIKPHLAAIKAQGIRLISNAGGVNPEQLAALVREEALRQGLAIRVAVVCGDNLSDISKLQTLGAREMYSQRERPSLDSIVSANAYLGAFPIAQALETGADIVITGRCVDSAVTLGIGIYEFGWRAEDLDALAAGSLVGHLLECGPQVTGGNFTDWELVADSLWQVGYPVAELYADGTAVITKPQDTGGLVSTFTVGEQLLYEIDDPAYYVLPDVICDWSEVKLTQIAEHCVRVENARGIGVPSHYKVSVTHSDGWRSGAVFFYAGRRAREKARVFAEEVRRRTEVYLAKNGLGPFSHFSLEVIGGPSESAGGGYQADEVAFKIACRHSEELGIQRFLKELSGVGLGAPAGFFSFAGARPKPTPVVELFSTLLPKSAFSVLIKTEDSATQWEPDEIADSVPERIHSAVDWPSCEAVSDMVLVPLEHLAVARSGDKGDKANVGVMARRAEFLPWIAQSLTTERLLELFSPVLNSSEMDCYYLPGIHALNFVFHHALGGGGTASLRADPQAKAYAQRLLQLSVAVPRSLIGD